MIPLLAARCPHSMKLVEFALSYDVGQGVEIVEYSDRDNALLRKDAKRHEWRCPKNERQIIARCCFRDETQCWFPVEWWKHKTRPDTLEQCQRMHELARDAVTRQDLIDACPQSDLY